MDSSNNSPQRASIPKKGSRNKLPSFKNRSNTTEEEELTPVDTTPEEKVQQAEQLLKEAGTSIHQIHSERSKKKARFTTSEAVSFSPPHITQPEPLREKTTSPEPTAEQPTTLESTHPAQTSEATISSKDIGILQTSTRSEHKRGFFHYFGILALLAALSASGLYLYKTITKITSNDTPSAIEISVQKQISDIEQEAAQQPTIEESDETVDQAKKVIADFINAKESRFAYSFIIQNPQTAQYFSKYWTAQKPFDTQRLNFVKGVKKTNEDEWIEFSYDSDPLRRVVMKRAQNSNFLLDWQTFAEVESLSLQTLKDSTSNITYETRAWLAPSNDHDLSYPNEHWALFVAHNLEGVTQKCYIPRKSGTYEKLQDALSRTPTNHPSTITSKGVYAKFLSRKSAIDETLVEIIDVTATTWTPELD